MLCSGVFVAQRPAAQVIREDILADNNPLLPWVKAEVDADRHRTSASFLHLARREAVYREGLGCTVAIHEPADRLVGESLPNRVVQSAPLPRAPGPPPGQDRVQAAILEAFAEPDPAKLRRTRAVVVLQDGRIVAEHYAPGFTAQTPQVGWSMSKTVTALLAGVLVADGKLTLERADLLPEWKTDDRSAITVDHLLHMSSGLKFDESYGNPRSDVVRMLYEAGDASRYAASQSLTDRPGSRFQYSTGTTQILSQVIRRTFSGNDQAYREFPGKALFAPLGMDHTTFELDESGTFLGASFVYASAHDWARLGLLLLNDGTWEGRRLLPPGWVRYMTTAAPAATKRNYGAHVWLKIGPPYNSLAAQPPVLPADAFHFIGHDAQFISVVPSQHLVVVRLGLSRVRPSWDQETFLASVIAALQP
jgi:CubicO group peptidase (beta-lactamase class C family)